jgi:hypothetical protein
MPNRRERSHKPSLLHLAAALAETGWIALRPTGLAASDASRFPAPFGGSIAADLIVNTPPNFIW